MRIAVTSQNFRTVTGHAGKSRRFLVFEGDPGHDPVEVDRLDLPKELSMHEYQGIGDHPLFAMDILITGGCGEGFRRKMAARGVAVAVTAETDPTAAVTQMLANPPKTEIADQNPDPVSLSLDALK